jgi:gluconate 2-dehydrogenase gamma chain
MKRREVLKKSVIAAAGIGALPNLFMLLESCGPERLTNYQPVFLSIEQYDTVWQIAELILPRTDSPGANDVAVAPYIDLLYSEFFGEQDLKKYETGLNTFMKNCMARFGKSFVELDENSQITILQALDKKENGTSFFKALKGFILWGYFTSEHGMKNLNYSPVPGKYEGCITIDNNEKIIVGNR